VAEAETPEAFLKEVHHDRKVAEQSLLEAKTKKALKSLEKKSNKLLPFSTSATLVFSNLVISRLVCLPSTPT